MNGQDRVTRKNILLADDQPEVRQTIRMLLDIDEHTVTEASNGQEALVAFAPGRFDLVITDYVMPYMRGDELAQNIKQLAPDQPILMITGSADPSHSCAFSVDGLLTKPFAFGDLRQAMAQLLQPVAA
jgi:CheY-like chemotaxis protein